MKKSHIEMGSSTFIGVGFLLCLTIIEFVSIMALNGGLLVYTLDDPYIHLALAENIKNGHYGINVGEFSAPSSSALWPFILAPFSSYSYAPFFLNVGFAIASVIVLVRTLEISIFSANSSIRYTVLPVITILLILATNMIGLIFTGMEHSLQLFVVLLIAYGLVVEITKDKMEWWLLAATIFAPLVRYECLAISLAAIIYLAMRGYFKQIIIAVLTLIVFLGAFSTFLMSLGLDAFPSSVVAKSSILQSGATLGRFAENFRESLKERQGVVLSFGALALLYFAFWGSSIKNKQLAVATLVAVFLHLIAGRYGFFHRYEIYVLAFELIVIVHLFLPLIDKGLMRSNKIRLDQFCAIAFAGGIAFVIAGPYAFTLYSIPKAANNIYEQQYQMHRFVVDYYKKPVAVNDLGYVSYQNSNYVLDLWGLGSSKALRSRLYSNDTNWKQDLVREENVHLVMIYDQWFGDIPDEWRKVGELHLGKKKITPAHDSVSFYAVSQDAYPDIFRKLELFSQTLPDGVEFQFEVRGG